MNRSETVYGSVMVYNEAMEQEGGALEVSADWEGDALAHRDQTCTGAGEEVRTSSEKQPSKSFEG